MLCTLSSGCATIINGTRQKIDVATDPVGATVSADEITVQSPCSLNLRRKYDHLVTISKPGYETEVVKVTPVLSAAVAGNIFLVGGLIGWGIDAADGAQYRLVPESINVKLRREVGKKKSKNPERKNITNERR